MNLIKCKVYYVTGHRCCRRRRRHHIAPLIWVQLTQKPLSRRDSWNLNIQIIKNSSVRYDSRWTILVGRQTGGIGWSTALWPDSIRSILLRSTQCIGFRSQTEDDEENVERGENWLFVEKNKKRKLVEHSSEYTTHLSWLVFFLSLFVLSASDSVAWCCQRLASFHFTSSATNLIMHKNFVAQSNCVFGLM